MPIMSQEEKRFFVQLGARIAELRKELGLTQQQLGEALETTQQQVAFPMRAPGCGFLPRCCPAWHACSG